MSDSTPVLNVVVSMPYNASDMKGRSIMGDPSSYFPSIEKKYGRPIRLDLHHPASPLERHMDLVNMLKAEYGLGHGHANALVAHALRQIDK